ncbi:MAG: hypothetical protein HQ512_00755 [Rhodospirillales bacterium]|nr:hypothetical protein [Rhodospirillales bacterium]
MKSEDVKLIGVVFLVWAVLAIMYATIPMIYMPASIRLWGAGAVMFLILAVVIARAEAAGRRKRASQ